MTLIRGTPVPPAVVYATHDRKYGITNLHESEAAALAERRRDPKWIDIVFYDRSATEKEGTST